MSTALAYDRSSMGRWTDADGRLHVPELVLSKAEINGYLGKEIPSYQTFGLDEDRVYQLLRPASELEKAAASFHGVPLLNRHIQVSALEPQRDSIVGVVLNPHFRDPHLLGELVFWDAKAIERVLAMEARKAGQPLSAGYRYRPQMTEGTYRGQSFDGIMKGIEGNHMACVEFGEGHDRDGRRQRASTGAAPQRPRHRLVLEKRSIP